MAEVPELNAQGPRLCLHIGPAEPSKWGKCKQEHVKE